MRTAIWAALTAMALAACGPDASAMIGGADEPDLDSSSGALVSNHADVWFPIAAGNSWTLAAVSPGASPATRTLTLTSVKDGVAHLNGLTSAGQWIAVDANSPNTLLGRPVSSAPWAPFIRFGYATTTWSWGSGSCGTFTARRVATDGSLVTAAGVFSGVRTIRFEQRAAAGVHCGSPAFRDLSFAPGVGLVALTTAAGDEYQLQSARVGGTSLPVTAAAGLVGSLTTDAPVYTNVPNTIVCITTPCPSNASNAKATFSYTVQNDAPVGLSVLSEGCIDYLDLVDSTGKVVASSSQTRFCEPNWHQLNFAPSESKGFGFTLELIDAAGQQLEGTFTANAFLVQRNGQPNVATASATITVKR